MFLCLVLCHPGSHRGVPARADEEGRKARLRPSSVDAGKGFHSAGVPLCLGIMYDTFPVFVTPSARDFREKIGVEVWLY